VWSGGRRQTNEITRFAALRDQIGDLCDALITVNAMHCQRDHAGYLAERGAPTGS
jgi:CHAD domain-containing protein